MSRFPAAFRPPAFASRSPCSRPGAGPSLRSAYRARHSCPDLDRVTAFRTRELRPGWVPSIPRGRRCSSRPEGVPGRRLPLPSGQSLHPRHRRSVGGARLTRHQRGFKQFTRPAIPLACGRPDGTSRRLGFPPGFAPRRPGADDARQGGDRPSSTDLELHAQHHISRFSNRVVHSQRATSCRTSSCSSLSPAERWAVSRRVGSLLLAAPSESEALGLEERRVAGLDSEVWRHECCSDDHAQSKQPQ